MEEARGARRAAEERLEAEAHHHLRAVGRRGMGPARIDRVGREARRGAARARPWSTSTPTEREGLAERRRLALAAAVRQRGGEDVTDPRDRQAGARASARRKAIGGARGRAREAAEAIRHCASHRSARDPTTRRSCSTSRIASLNIGFGGEGPRRRLPLDLRLLRVVHALLRHRLRLRRALSQVDRHARSCAWPTRRCCRSVHRHRRHACRATSTRSRSWQRRKKDAPPIDFAAAAHRGRARCAGAAGVREGLRRGAGHVGQGAAAPAGSLQAGQPAVYSSERRLGNEKGLPRRDWFKHLVYAPGFYTGYGVKTLPQSARASRKGSGRGQGGLTKVAAASPRSPIRSIAPPRAVGVNRADLILSLPPTRS